MANFKVGQRVKIVGMPEEFGRDYVKFIGAETVITSDGYERWGTFGYRTALSDSIPYCIGVPAKNLVPLTDPKADAFIAQMKKLAREPNLKPETIGA